MHSEYLHSYQNVLVLLFFQSRVYTHVDNMGYQRLDAALLPYRGIVLSLGERLLSWRKMSR